MTIRALIAAAAVAVAVLGCAHIPPDTRTNRPCGDTICFVEISVVPGANCRDPNFILVTPDPLKIAAGKQNVTIQWRIDDASSGAKYTFDQTKGIAFLPDSPFSGGRRLDPSKYQWQDRNDPGDTKYYKYTVNLLKDGTACAAKDPFIANSQ
jgi:hypothetical protein